MHWKIVSSEFCCQVKFLSGAPLDIQKALSMITAVCSFLRGLGLGLRVHKTLKHKVYRCPEGGKPGFGCVQIPVVAVVGVVRELVT